MQCEQKRPERALSCHLPAVNRPKMSRKEKESVSKQSSASKGAAEQALTQSCSRQENGVQFLQYKTGSLSGHLPAENRSKISRKEKSQFSNNQVRAKGPLSGHLHTVNRPKIRPKRKESVVKQGSASKKDS